MVTELFNDGKVSVYEYGSGEIFVENLKTGVTIRVTDIGDGFTVTAHGLNPTSVNGLDAFRVTR